MDELEVREHPRVIFRVSDNTWLEAIVRYVVPPREAGRIKTRLIKNFSPVSTPSPIASCSRLARTGDLSVVPSEAQRVEESLTVSEHESATFKVRDVSTALDMT